ncbi:Os02g0580800 [Oryza sativa Japonica Group]|uniref:Os02g0580800 protein n=1 Tax=Oryza sativa subsp. japonica TaxID=39947 RepID=Q6EP37_ORYSJ|nr:unknown protein [Oryza sativa Japonica Group]BAD29583.1 unknown protein [Oryza sativa Japonica Group]BAH91766.1 Os02g0580800 [Oryza sativa Japonica Group]|eukprot:NP_001173037.1 Os02g0580800 [Oryza sativa Japonica Group]
MTLVVAPRMMMMEFWMIGKLLPMHSQWMTTIITRIQCRQIHQLYLHLVQCPLMQQQGKNQSRVVQELGAQMMHSVHRVYPASPNKSAFQLAWVTVGWQWG